jgi:hypothetical protein
MPTEANSTANVASVYSSFFFTVDLLFLGASPCYSAAQIGIRDALRLVFRIPETGTKNNFLIRQRGFVIPPPWAPLRARWKSSLTWRACATRRGNTVIGE